MAKSSATKDAQALFHSLRSAYAATPTNLKIIDLYVMFAIFTALIQVVWLLLDHSHSTLFFLGCFLVLAQQSLLKQRKQGIQGLPRNVLLRILFSAI
ncbi:Dolichyl-diphosphooligosaccharide-protein glycosyltransferase subunit dad1 [Datura stramonium]|uniref:Dolichyl-diphosphooligosaccharide--protein glycosyltransferase subunit DAD1 n=1 Tax=Datura stramonium TaxID=4076 RepID=A0ABS8STV1_DATST|nr:Dolichyl-diphosphooligosaccharide-protein glycosyltransferase subunit dad1 [Datura stramonium]